MKSRPADIEDEEPLDPLLVAAQFATMLWLNDDEDGTEVAVESVKEDHEMAAETVPATASKTSTDEAAQAEKDRIAAEKEAEADRQRNDGSLAYGKSPSTPSKKK